MFKKLSLILIVLFFAASISWANEENATIYPVEPATTEKHIEQIKWAHNQGYVFGVLASYGVFKKVNYQENFVLPVIKTAWEKGYVEGVLYVYELEKEKNNATTN